MQKIVAEVFWKKAQVQIHFISFFRCLEWAVELERAHKFCAASLYGLRNETWLQNLPKTLKAQVKPYCWWGIDEVVKYNLSLQALDWSLEAKAEFEA